MKYKYPTGRRPRSWLSYNLLELIAQITNSLLSNSTAMATLKLLLTPSLVCDLADQSIHVRMTLTNIPSTAKDQILFHHTLVTGPIKTQQYTTDDIHLGDTLLDERRPSGYGRNRGVPGSRDSAQLAAPGVLRRRAYAGGTC